jgi:potassium-dependent mechanosensitive channel
MSARNARDIRGAAVPSFAHAGYRIHRFAAFCTTSADTEHAESNLPRPPMLDRLRRTACILFGVLLLAIGVARAGQSDQAASASPAAQAAPTAAAAAPPKIDTAEITRRTNQEVGGDIEAAGAGWQRDLDRIESELRRPRLGYSDLNALRDDLQRVRAAIDEFAKHLNAPLEAAKTQASSLGPAPADGREPEQAAISRAEINYRLGLLTAAQAAANTNRVRIDQLANTVQDIRRRNFTSNLFQPVPGIYSYDTWAYLPTWVPWAVGRLGDLVSNWWKNLRDRDEVRRTGLEALLLGLALTLVRWRGVRRLRRWREAGEPAFWKRASSAAGVVLLRAMPIVLPVLFAYTFIQQNEPLPERVGWLFYSAAQAVITIFAVSALVTSVLAPAASHWRLIPASDRAARRLYVLAIALAGLYGVTSFAYVAARLVQAPFGLTIAITLPSVLLLAGIIVAMMLTPLDGEHQEALPLMRWLKALRMPVWVAIASIVISALSGYLALSRFLVQQLIVTGSILALVYLLLLWVDGFSQGLTDEHAALGTWLETKAKLDRRRRERLALPAGLSLKFAILVLSVPLIMLQWGYAWPDILDWYRQLFFGFHIANTQVTFAALLASVIVFGLGYGAARLFQTWLDARVLQPAGISGGVRDSIRTGVGYVGVTVAALTACSYAGFNLSNLAILAGAFSVGIGFGLQSVVNNFVSGLILLAERPIKVGDLVAVGGEEGCVRKISVRSTEIETFDRASVLVPNAYFITEKVKNWTLRNNMRRLLIGVGVAYDSDPRQVRDILLEVARGNPDVMTTPAPFVDLEEFGADSLDFKLYVFLYDLTKTSSVRTELRIAILDRFRAAGITIPFRQTDITIRSAESLGRAFHETAAKSHSGNGNGSSALHQVSDRGLG